MTAHRAGGPWSGTTYHGFAGPPLQAPPPEPTLPAPSPTTRNLLIGGVVGAAALGLLLGLLSKPNLNEGAEPTPPVRPAAAAPAPAPPVAATVPIEINPPAPLPAPKASGRLDVLPPDLARAAPRAATAAPAPPPAPRADPQVEAVSPQIAVAAPPPAPATPKPPEAAPPAARASFDCSFARGQAEEMVCANPTLAAADRQLARAYLRALDAGVPTGQLRAEQQDWLEIREDAAQRSPRALASVYEQRIQELNAIADDGGPPQ